MLGATWRRWYVSLEQHPGLTVARFGTAHPAAGHQIWDEVPWPLAITEHTESYILSEIYAATLDFWQTRR